MKGDTEDSDALLKASVTLHTQKAVLRYGCENDPSIGINVDTMIRPARRNNGEANHKANNAPKGREEVLF